MPALDGTLTVAELMQIYALVKAQGAVRAQLAQVAVGGALAPLRTLRSWWDSAEILLAVLQILRITQPTQLRMAQVTDAYMARVLTIMTGRTVRPLGAVDIRRLRRELTPDLARRIDRPPVLLEPDGELGVDRFFDVGDVGRRGWPESDGGKVREPGVRSRGRNPADDVVGLGGDGSLVRAVDMVDVYSRIAAEFRYHVTEGMSEEKAKQRALRRAEVVADMDVALAMRAQVNKWMLLSEDRNIVGYRRILHPELSESGPCGLCVVAADRVYTREDLLPLHDRCKCEVLPIRGRMDPGLRLNKDDLGRLYQAAGGTTSGRELKKVRVAITEHGELGPILREAPKNPRGKLRRPSQVVSDGRGYRTLSAEERLPTLEWSLENMTRRFDEGDTRFGPVIADQLKLIERLRRELNGR